MKKINLSIVTFISILAVSGIAGASMIIPASDQAKRHSKAPENSPVINENWELERIDFIHYAKPDNPGKQRGEKCYKLLGVKWKESPVSYVINPANPDGLTENFVTSAVSASGETWDSETSLELLNGAYSVDYSAEYGIQNYENAVVFGDYPDDRVIAVTSIWYTPKGRRIVEFDMMFNTRFDWGDATSSSTLPIMDLQNIATHEFGHAVGLDDVYSDTCSAETMYGYSAERETNKRTLEQPDIAGLQKMYGI
jgi:hypothetical protein